MHIKYSDRKSLTIKHNDKTGWDFTIEPFYTVLEEESQEELAEEHSSQILGKRRASDEETMMDDQSRQDSGQINSMTAADKRKSKE